MTIEVAAGVLCDSQGRVLLSQRSADKHLAGTWEFPGGKLEQDESPQQALHRELSEELGIDVLAAQPLITVYHRYPEKAVRLHVFEVLRWQGEVRSLEQQPLRWASYDELCQLDMPEADAPIINALRLPGQYLITPQCLPNQQHLFVKALESSLCGGRVGIVQLRQPGWTAEQLMQLADNCRSVCTAAGAQLVINCGLDHEFNDLANGIHLNSGLLRELTVANNIERPIPKNRLLGASCHDAEELSLALLLGCDYGLLSPVKPTTSHPQASPLGWKRFAELTASSNLPVYALGGLQPEDQDQARSNGAVGVAGIAGFWRA